MAVLTCAFQSCMKMQIKSSFEIDDDGDKPPDHNSLSWQARIQVLCTGTWVSGLLLSKD